MSLAAGGEKKPARKPYAKPVAKRVHLKPEEAVLGACKASSQYGPVGSNCAPAGPCSILGS